jgi:hypothetical protein
MIYLYNIVHDIVNKTVYVKLCTVSYTDTYAICVYVFVYETVSCVRFHIRTRMQYVYTFPYMKPYIFGERVGARTT